MHKLLAMYRQPDDAAAFDKYYADVHRPLVERVPGLQKLVLNRGVEAPWGAPEYYLVAELHFADEASFKTALASPEFAAAGKDVRKFAGNIVTLMIARVD